MTPASKRWIIFLGAIALSCHKTDTAIAPACQTQDFRFVGSWVLDSECTCYSLGSFAWQPPKSDYAYTFDEHCGIIEKGDLSEPCNTGQFSVRTDTLKVLWNCPNGAAIIDTYQFQFTHADSITITGYVDDAYFGRKFHRVGKK